MFVSIPKRFLYLENTDVFSAMDLYSINNKNLIEIFEPIVYYGAQHIESCFVSFNNLQGVSFWAEVFNLI